MSEKTTLTKLAELAMYCQNKFTREQFSLINKMPDSPHKTTALNNLRNYYNDFMTDCTALLEAERKYLKNET